MGEFGGQTTRQGEAPVEVVGVLLGDRALVADVVLELRPGVLERRPGARHRGAASAQRGVGGG